MYTTRGKSILPRPHLRPWKDSDENRHVVDIACLATWLAHRTPSRSRAALPRQFIPTISGITLYPGERNIFPGGQIPQTVEESSDCRQQAPHVYLGSPTPPSPLPPPLPPRLTRTLAVQGLLEMMTFEVRRQAPEEKFENSCCKIRRPRKIIGCRSERCPGDILDVLGTEDPSSCAACHRPASNTMDDLHM